MNNTPQNLSSTKVVIDRILESAVILSWNDLPHASSDNLIKIEYPSGAVLPYLKIWQLTGKGIWSLVCEYWMARGPNGLHPEGATFSNGYHSAGLAEMLKTIMQHQGNFFPSAWKTGTGMIQVALPTEQESLTANACMKQAYESFGLTYAHIAGPAVA